MSRTSTIATHAGRSATWEFVSVIASGGVAEPINGDTPVWEPFLMLYQDQMICFYSDQRDPSYGQKLVHQTSYDLKSWGPVVDDVTYSNYTYRPGMTTVSELPNGQYFMTYEFYGAVEGGSTTAPRETDASQSRLPRTTRQVGVLSHSTRSREPQSSQAMAMSRQVHHTTPGLLTAATGMVHSS